MEVIVGRIGRPHGIRGEVTIDVRTDDPEGRLAPGASLRTDPEHLGPLTVETGRVHAGRLLLRFAGYPDRTAVEALRGVLLVAEVDPAERTGDPDEFFDHQLVGLRVLTVDGADVGEVADVLHLPGQDVLAVRTEGGGEALVPFVAAIVPEVDLDARTVRIDPPPGLISGEAEEA